MGLSHRYRDMDTFRRFMKSQTFDISLKEIEAAPAAGMASPPQGSSTTNKHHFDSLERELDIDDIKPALEGSPVTLYQLLRFDWPFRTESPVEVSVEEKTPSDDGEGNGFYEVTYFLTKINKHKFVHPYKDGVPVYAYQGEITDRTEVITQEELSNGMVPPLEQGGGAGGMAPPMGGAPMGGAPPMPGMM